jgi:beta-glucanase (GH16 family)
VYGVQWSPDEISWHLDGVRYQRLAPGDVPGPWPFRHHFYLLVNLAVGGAWPGNTADGLALPATMLVDWIRVHGGHVERTGPHRV